MTSQYPQGADNRASNADPRSPFFVGHVCKDCDQNESDCKCESPELIAAREVQCCADELLTDLSEQVTAVEDVIEKNDYKIAALTEWRLDEVANSTAAEEIKDLIFTYKFKNFDERGKLIPLKKNKFHAELKFNAAQGLVKKLEA